MPLKKLQRGLEKLAVQCQKEDFQLGVLLAVII
jgi:hypothetical protein